MAYVVDAELPKYCNKCPFGCLNYRYGYKIENVANWVDGKKNEKYTYGYTCTLDRLENGKYTEVMRANIEEDIHKPVWCPLKDCS